MESKNRQVKYLSCVEQENPTGDKENQQAVANVMQMWRWQNPGVKRWEEAEPNWRRRINVNAQNMQM